MGVSIMRVTASHAILSQLADEQRHVLSGWRGLILLRRATFDLSPDERRWRNLPRDVGDLTPTIRQMRGRGELTQLDGLHDLYQVTVPYAAPGAGDERETLFEAHPYAALSHLSALMFHGLTEQMSKVLMATIPADGRGGLLPMGTDPADWKEVPAPHGRTPDTIHGRSVDWILVKPERFFGFAEYQPLGYPLRYTTPERTLIDGLLHPDLCGGIVNVLNAWRLAQDIIDLDTLLASVERFDADVLRRRVGYVLDQLGIAHPMADRWRANARRGKVSCLVASSSSFAATYDERWNLSLNAPVGILHERAG